MAATLVSARLISSALAPRMLTQKVGQAGSEASKILIGKFEVMPPSENQQRSAVGDVQHGPAREVAAASDEREAAAQRERLSRPERDRRRGAHDPVGVVGVQVHGAAEALGPLDHPRVVVRVRDRDPGQAAAVLDLGRRVA